MHAKQWLGRGVVVLAACALTASAVSGLPDRMSVQQGKGQQDASRSKPAGTVVASGCLQDVSELGGQGGGGASWQGSVSGHVLTDVQMTSAAAPNSAATGGGKPSTVPDAAASQTAPDLSRPPTFLITGLPETELRRHRGQQVEVRGTIGQRRDVTRASPSGSGGGSSGSTPNGRVAGEPSAPAVGTGGSLRVPPAPPSGGTQPPTEFHATSIRVLGRSCPSPAR
jgi:hypothetical protein